MEEYVILNGEVKICKSLFDTYCKLGYIKTGIDSKGHGIYSLTSFGKSQLGIDLKLELLK
jgi:hypothetical protein